MTSRNIIFSILILFLISCSTLNKGPIKPKVDRSNWERIDTTEEEFRNYFDENKTNLDRVEGIWRVGNNTTWINVISGIKGEIDNQRMYKIGIIKDPHESLDTYKGYILEVGNDDMWRVGDLKCIFYKTVYSDLYEVIWYMGDYTKEDWKGYIEDDRLGTINYETHRDKWSEYPINYESKTISTKLYPPFSSGKVSQGQFENNEFIE